MNISKKAFKEMMKGSHATIRDPIKFSSSNLERNSSNAIEKPYAPQAFKSPVIITLHSFRYRLADPDGLCGKYAIDSIVKSGLLADDSSKEIQEVRFRQTKIKKPTEESTIITIEEADEKIY